VSSDKLVLVLGLVVVLAISAYLLQRRALRQRGFSIFSLGAAFLWLAVLLVLVFPGGSSKGFALIIIMYILSALADSISAPFDQDRKRPKVPLARWSSPKAEMAICLAIGIFVVTFAGLAFSNAFGFGEGLATLLNRFLTPLKDPRSRSLSEFVLTLIAIVVVPVGTALKHIEKRRIVAISWNVFIGGSAWFLCHCLHLYFALL
jgi:hypothetical protein